MYLSSFFIVRFSNSNYVDDFLVIPAFADIFQRMHIDLPYLTATILSIGLNIKAHFIKLCVSLLIIFIAIILVGQKDKLRLIFCSIY